MSAPPPVLLIGFGQTALQTIASVLRFADEHRWERPACIGIAEQGERPETFPAECYFALEVDPERQLGAFGDTLPDYLSNWFDAEEMDTLARQQKKSSRPFERLAWFSALRAGSQSDLYRLWSSQLYRASRAADTLQVLFIADLSEPLGSSLLIDAVCLTLGLAASSNLQLPQTPSCVLWTVLPHPHAPAESQLRAAAGLRELKRFMSLQQVRGIPFRYALDSSASEAGLSGILTGVPFLAWYALEGQSSERGAASAALGTALLPYLDAEALRFEITRVINLAKDNVGNFSAAKPTIWVGSRSVRSLELPMRQIMRGWASRLLRDSFAPLLAPPDPRLSTSLLVHSFWEGWGSRLFTPLAITKPIPALSEPNLSLPVRLEALEQFLRGTSRNYDPNDQSSWIARRKTVLNQPLRTENYQLQAFFETARGLVAEIERPDTHPDGNDYAQRMSEACQDQLHNFIAVLNRTLQEALTVTPETHSRPTPMPMPNLSALDEMLNEIQRDLEKQYEALYAPPEFDVAAAHQQLQQREADFWQLTGIWAMRRGNLLNDYREKLQTLVLMKAWAISYRLIRRLLENLLGIVLERRKFIAEWRDALSAAVRGYEQNMVWEVAEDETQLQTFLLFTSIDDQWLDAQYRRYLNKANRHLVQRERLKIDWELSTSTVVRFLGRAFSVHTLATEALSACEPLFADALAECTLSVLLQEEQDRPAWRPEQLARFLIGAERPSLTLKEVAHSQRHEIGYVYAVNGQQIAQEPTIGRIVQALNREHYAGTTFADFVRPLNHTDPHLLHYLHLIEKLDLEREVGHWERLQTNAERAGQRFQQEFVFAAEKLMMQLSQHQGAPFVPLPTVAQTLNDPRRLQRFWVAYWLGGIHPETRTNDGRYEERLVYQAPEGKPPALTLPLTDWASVADITAALTTFVTATDSSSALSPAVIDAQIEAEVQHVITQEQARLLDAALPPGLSETQQRLLQNQIAQARSRLPQPPRLEVERLLAYLLLLQEWRNHLTTLIPNADILELQHLQIIDYLWRSEQSRLGKRADAILQRFTVPVRPTGKLRF